MNALTRQSLDRTLLLMRDDLRDEVSDATLVDALTQTEIVLVGDANNLSSHAAQCAFVTTALLMARSGHRVFLEADDVPIIGNQPPLSGDSLVKSLLEVGADLLPGIGFKLTRPQHAIDLCVRFGDSQAIPEARRVMNVNASAWSAFVSPADTGERWKECEWPFGALAAAALVAGEAFKMSMHKLHFFARHRGQFDQLFAFCDRIQFDLAPPNTRRVHTLGDIDFISGGAITNASLYVLSRILRVTGNARVIEPDTSDLTNLNRYMLLRYSSVGTSKAKTLESLDLSGIGLCAAYVRFGEETLAAFGRLAPHVLVGVDHIPTRWSVQKAHPQWLGIGATTHWNAMSSYHREGLACAWCTHPRDDVNDAPIPTIAFVSFWAGLLLATQFVRSIFGEVPASSEQQIFFTPLRPETPWWSPVAIRPDCPICNRHDWHVAA